MFREKSSILIVEDDSFWTSLYCEALKKETIAIRTAYSVHNAIEQLKNQSFAVVIVDLKITGIDGSEMGGIDLFKTIKQKWPYTEVIVITAYGTIPIAFKAGEMGAGAFIQKPVDFDQLKTIVNQAIKSYEQKLKLHNIEKHKVIDPILLIEQLLTSFPDCVQYLQERGHCRPSFLIENEYDVQDLLYVMLKPHFPDLKREEYTQQDTSGSAKRVDFVIGQLGILLEVKHIKGKMQAKKVFDEVKIDIESYYAHPQCSTLVFFIYDPQREIVDAQAKMRGMRGERKIYGKGIQVKVIIQPY